MVKRSLVHMIVANYDYRGQNTYCSAAGRKVVFINFHKLLGVLREEWIKRITGQS